MRPTTRIGAVAATVVATAALLLVAAPPPAVLVGEVAATLRDPQLAVDRGGADGAVLLVAASGAWLVLCWLGCALALVALGALPGPAGRVARRAARRIVPGTVRHLLSAALGIGLAAGLGAATTAGPAWAGATPPAATAGIGTATVATAGPGSATAGTAGVGTATAGPARTGATSPVSPGAGAWPGALPPHPPAAGATPWAGPIPPDGLDLDWPVAAPTAAASDRPDAGDLPAQAPTGANGGHEPAQAPIRPDRGHEPAQSPTRANAGGSAAAPDPATSVRGGTPGSVPTGPPAGALRHEHPTTVTVRSGDSLWAIAGRHLGPGATTPEIAAAWPRWWAANRDTVGADPNVIHPGQRLTAPGSDPITGSTP